MSCRFLKSLTLIMFNVTSNIMQCSYVLSCLRGLAKSQHTYLESKPFLCLWSSFRRISLENFRFSFWFLGFFSTRSLSLSLLLSFFLFFQSNSLDPGIWNLNANLHMLFILCISFCLLPKNSHRAIFKQCVLICIKSYERIPLLIPLPLLLPFINQLI